MNKPHDVAAAASVLLATLAGTFGRVSENLHATSVQLAKTCERIRASKAARSVA